MTERHVDLEGELGYFLVAVVDEYRAEAGEQERMTPHPHCATSTNAARGPSPPATSLPFYPIDSPAPTDRRYAFTGPSCLGPSAVARGFRPRPPG